LQYDSSSNGAADYRSLAKEVLEMMAPQVTVTVRVQAPPAAPVAAGASPAGKVPRANQKSETRMTNQARMTKSETAPVPTT
jgi:hypothetical protein